MSDTPQATAAPAWETPLPTESPLPSRRRAAARSMLAGYVLLALYFAAAGGSYWYVSRPDYRFRQAWRALDNTDYEQVRHEASRLGDTPGYAPHARLLEAAVVVRTMSSQTESATSNMYQSLNRKLVQALQHPDTKPLSLLIMGEALTNASAYREARAVLTEAVYMDPNLTRAFILLAQLSYDAGSNEDAMNALYRATRLDDLNPRPYRLMGLISFELHNIDDAISNYTESLRRSLQSPDRDQMLLELAECELMDDRVDDALTTLASVRRDSALKYYLRARCHFERDNVEEARADLRRSLEEEPDNARALLLKGTIALEAKDFDAARSALSQAVDADPSDVEARTKLWQLYQQLGKRALAEREVKVTNRIRQAGILIDTTLQRASRDPTNPELRYLVGAQFLELERPDDAIRWFRMALALDPSHASSRQAMEELGEQLDRSVVERTSPTP